MPTGQALAEWMATLPLARHLGLAELPEPKRTNPLAVAQIIVDDEPSVREELHNSVHAHLCKLEQAATLSLVLRTIARTPNYPGLILTLNYDTLVERAARLIGRGVESLGLADIPHLLSDGLQEKSQTLRVLHLHGSLDEPPERLILDAESYARQAADDRVKDLVTALLAHYNLCIIGTSFEEQYLATALSRARPKMPRHVVVCDATLADSIRSGKAQLSTELHNILVCDYPAGEHHVLDPFCERLIQCSAPADAATNVETLERETPRIDLKYTQRRAVVRDANDVVSDENIEWRLALGSAVALTESDLQSEPRCVIVGSPGSGKSWILERFAQNPIAGERSVLIRLRDVRQSVGDADALLESWVSAGAVLDDGPPIAASALQDGSVRLHVLLDGLDELPRSSRTSIAEAVVRVASANPAQRFTVSSRPIGALEAFGEEWKQVELLCDSTWREELLSKFEMTTQSLANSLGSAYGKLEPLLTIPFFLRATVDLLEENKDVSHSMDLALGLLDRILAADTVLSTVQSELRNWLTRVALTMSLSGQTSLSLSELNLLAEDMSIGEIEEATDLLASRALLHVSNDRYSFGHRLIGEALVACELETEDPGPWLDVIVPRVDEISAAREDWRGVLEFLLPRSANWRRSIATRDSLQAARLTPEEASSEERLEAGFAIWNRADKLNIWIEQRGIGQSFDDGQIVGRLIGTGDVPALEQAVRQGLESDSRFRRGNAIEVLAAARVRDIESTLRRTIVDDTDIVVRRIAASWARRLGLKSLRNVIVERACNPADDSEATDMASISLALSTPEERMLLARRMIASGNKQVHDWQVVGDATPSRKLLWLAERSSSEDIDDWWVREKFDGILAALNRPSAIVCARLGFVAAINQMSSASTLSFLARHKSTTAGLLDAIDANLVKAYEIPEQLLAVGSKSLTKFGASAETVEMVAAWEQARTERRESGPSAPTREQAPRKRIEVLTLQKILDLDEEDMRWQIFRNQSRLVSEISTASETTKLRVIAVLDGMWMNVDLRDAVEIDGTHATIQQWATLVLAFGPALNWQLDDDKWTQVATCGWLFEPQIQWLLPQATSDRILAGAKAPNAHPRGIADLLRLSNSNVLVQAVDAFVSRSPERLDDEAIDRLVNILDQHNSLPALEKLCELGPEVEATARTAKANAGDRTAIASELKDLTERLADVPGHRIEPPKWLNEISDSTFADPLADLIVAAGRSTREPFNNILGAAQSALERVEPMYAVRYYEQLIVNPPWDGAQFCVDRLEAATQRLMVERGNAAAVALATARRLPVTQP